jgi:predicted metal-dependent hydrolase
MFAEWLRRLKVRPPAPHWQLRAGSPLVAFSAVQFAVPFFIVVLTGELTTDLLQRDAAELGELHPTLRQMLRLHHVEEARHIAFAKDFLEKQFQDLSRAERQAVRLIAPAVAGGVARTLTTVPRYEGLPSFITDAMLREASHSDARIGLLKRAFRPLVRYFEDIDLITGRERPLWRRLHVLPETA